MSNINQDSKYARGIPGFRVRPQHLVAPDPLITAPPPVTVNGSGGVMEYKEIVDSFDRVMEGMVETVTDDASNELDIKIEWLRSNLQDLPVDSVLQLTNDIQSLIARGADDFSAVDDVSSLKPGAVPEELHVSSTEAGGAVDFSSVDGVSSLMLKPFSSPLAEPPDPMSVASPIASPAEPPDPMSITSPIASPAEPSGSVNGVIGGEMNGVMEGTVNGVTEGVMKGVINGLVNGVIGGEMNGVMEGAVIGLTEGVMNMVMEGAVDRMIEGVGYSSLSQFGRHQDSTFPTAVAGGSAHLGRHQVSPFPPAVAGGSAHFGRHQVSTIPPEVAGGSAHFGGHQVSPFPTAKLKTDAQIERKKRAKKRKNE